MKIGLTGHPNEVSESEVNELQLSYTVTGMSEKPFCTVKSFAQNRPASQAA